MQCSGCGYEALPAYAFCPKCGSKLPTACPSCGAVCPPDFRFCASCGVRLAAASAQQPAPPFDEATPEMVERARTTEGSAEADRRPVTVLFADLSGFTALSERLDPEDVRAFQSDLFQEMAAVVEHYEGFVEKFVGDAIMAVFGAPVAHEDDPERTLRAALA